MSSRIISYYNIVREELLERRQRAAIERSGEGCAAGVGDLGVVDVERPEVRQHTCRRRRCTYRQRCHKGGEALVAERVAERFFIENELLLELL